MGLEAIRETNRVGADMATLLLGPIGAGAFAILVMISATGSVNGTIIAAPRVYYAMAKDGIFFKWLDYIHPKYRTPSRAILLQCGWCAVILLVRGSFETIVTGMVFVILIFYAVTTMALFVLRHQNVWGHIAALGELSQYLTRNRARFETQILDWSCPKSKTWNDYVQIFNSFDLKTKHLVTRPL